ncbi:MAG: thioesterase family protein [Christensenellales bacterium]|jgi:fluoroacetyl-CoA thioesterase
MDFSFPTGKQAQFQLKVEQRMTARTLKSGALDVLGTPYLIALMEAAAVKAIPLPEGYTSVGTLVNIQHTAATPVGMQITVTATITGSEGRRVLFRVEAADEKGPIGHGDHERFIVDAQRFIDKTYAKLK